jgi:hypothetical protein
MWRLILRTIYSFTALFYGTRYHFIRKKFLPRPNQICSYETTGYISLWSSSNNSWIAAVDIVALVGASSFTRSHSSTAFSSGVYEGTVSPVEMANRRWTSGENRECCGTHDKQAKATGSVVMRARLQWQCRRLFRAASSVGNFAFFAFAQFLAVVPYGLRMGPCGFIFDSR